MTMEEFELLRDGPKL